MQPYPFTQVEQKWQAKWKEQKLLPHSLNLPTSNGPKYYLLNMFPYPSGSGLHVGHYAGYVASDILSRYYRHNGYQVMNPMGFDAFGLPAEQHAIQTGQHPAVTTSKNIKKYINQLNQVGLDFDWHNAVNTSDPAYYKWTQWIFLQMFNSWYNTATQKAMPIHTLIESFACQGNAHITAACDDYTPIFSAQAWNGFSEREKQVKLLHYRLAYLKDSTVNWCEALGTVLANEEVKDGLSERGGYPVTRKKMKQWSLRMTAYAERLLKDLDSLDWPLSTKEMQRNWLGKSEGAEVIFNIQGQTLQTIKIFTTRPETIFGASFIALAPEHPWANYVAKNKANPALIHYIERGKNRSERSRLATTNDLNSLFTDSYAIHPFTGRPVPIWVADYVLPGYGTGALMGVPAHDKRDYIFAQNFNLPILPVIEPTKLTEQPCYEGSNGKMIHSEFLDGLSVSEAVEMVIKKLTQTNIGTAKINYRLQDPIFSRQRYWGEPFPIYYKEDGIPYPLELDQLPLVLPEVSSYQPNKFGSPPLGNALNWSTPEGYPLDLHTMPGWAGSSWYFLRYMDPHNQESFLSQAKEAYWKGVDFYIGGSEHATGHLLYARFWTKLLYDLGHIHITEPFPKLFHQGMIQKRTAIVYRLKDKNSLVSNGLIDQHDVIPLYIPIDFVQNNILDIKALKNWRPEFADTTFLLEEGKYICGGKMEKMSKSKYNVVDPDKVIAQYGADALRLYLMFLGPLEQSKPWDLSGIEGVFRFLNKVWRLVHYAKESWIHTQPVSSPEILKVINQTIKKVTESIQKCSFNTAVSTLMICINTLSTFEQLMPSVIEKIILLLEPFAPHIAAELWEHIGKTDSITQVSFPVCDEIYLEEKSITYPIAINGKVRTQIVFDYNALPADIEKTVLADEVVQKWILGKVPKNIVIVPNKMVNVVV